MIVMETLWDLYNSNTIFKNKLIYKLIPFFPVKLKIMKIKPNSKKNSLKNHKVVPINWKI